MPRRTKAEALETRNTILDAAIDVFFEKGVNSSSLNDIARKAKVTRGAIYWHFKNKLHIFSALHDQLHSYLADTIFNDLQNDQPLFTLFRTRQTARTFAQRYQPANSQCSPARIYQWYRN
mgnify:CR=1 FL=1